jgi:hypothetical protein
MELTFVFGWNLERSHSRPIFTVAPKNVSVVIGERAELRVEILSHPEFALQWVKHDLDDPNQANVVQVETGV